MYRKGREDEPNQYPHRYGHQKIHLPAKRQLEDQLRHQRRQAGPEKPRIDIAAEPGAVHQRIGGGADQNRQDVHRVLSPEGISHIDEHCRHGQPGELDFFPAQQPQPHAHHQHGVQESGGISRQPEIVRNQGIPGDHDDPESFHSIRQARPLPDHACRPRRQQQCHGTEAEHLQLPSLQPLPDRSAPHPYLRSALPRFPRFFLFPSV